MQISPGFTFSLMINWILHMCSDNSIFGQHAIYDFWLNDLNVELHMKTEFSPPSPPCKILLWPKKIIPYVLYKTYCWHWKVPLCNYDSSHTSKMKWNSIAQRKSDKKQVTQHFTPLSKLREPDLNLWHQGDGSSIPH